MRGGGGGCPYLTKDHAQNGLGIAFAAVVDVPPPDAPPLPSLSDESDDVRRLPNVIFQVLVGRALVLQPSKPNPVLGGIGTFILGWNVAGTRGG